MSKGFLHITGKLPVIIVEGATDRIFLEALRRRMPSFSEPDYLQLEGVGELNNKFSDLKKSASFLTIPSIKVIIDSDNLDGRWQQIKSLLRVEDLEEGSLNEISRSAFKANMPGSIKVGGLLLRGRDPNAPDLEGLISDSVNEIPSPCSLHLEQAFSSNRGYSKRLRFAQRAFSQTELEDVSYHSLYGRGSDIDFDSQNLAALKAFLELE